MDVVRFCIDLVQICEIWDPRPTTWPSFARNTMGCPRSPRTSQSLQKNQSHRIYQNRTQYIENRIHMAASVLNLILNKGKTKFPTQVDKFPTLHKDASPATETRRECQNRCSRAQYRLNISLNGANASMSSRDPC